MVHRVVLLDAVVAAGIGVVVVGLAMGADMVSSLAWLSAGRLQFASVWRDG